MKRLGEVRKNRNLNLLKRFLKEQLVSLCDVGAAGGLERRWQPYQDVLEVCSFEPDARSSSENVVAKGVWSKETTVPLYLTQKPQCSSVFSSPMIKYLELFPESKTVLKIVDKVEVPHHKR